MFKLVKKLLAIVRNYDNDLKLAHKRIADLEKVIQDRTNVCLDVGFRGANHVIVVGRYKDKDFIQCYDVKESEFSGLIDRLREMNKYGRVARVDAPPTFSAVFDRLKDRGDFV